VSVLLDVADRPSDQGEELRVDPVLLRRPDRRDPALFVGLALAVFVLAAIAKPWESVNRGAPNASSQASGSAGASARSSPSSSSPGLLAQPTLSPDQLVEALGSHGLWGVAAIAKRPATDATELWVPIEGPSPNSVNGGEPRVFLGTAGYAVQALVITSPPGQIVLLGRSWRVRPGIEPEPLTVRPFRSQTRGGPTVLIPPPDSAFGQDRWSPGTYKFEVVLASVTATLTVVVIGRANGRRV
jgi:hypothetical protein